MRADGATMPDVAREREAEPRAGRRSVHGGDDRLLAAQRRAHPRADPGVGIEPLDARRRGSVGRLREIEAGAERASRPRDDDDAHRVRPPRRRPGGGERRGERAVHGVQLVGAIERDRPNAVGGRLDQEVRVVGHAESCRPPHLLSSGRSVALAAPRRRGERLRDLARELGEPDEVGAVAVASSPRAPRASSTTSRPGQRAGVRRVAQQHAEAGDGAREAHRLRGRAAARRRTGCVTSLLRSPSGSL